MYTKQPFLHQQKLNPRALAISYSKHINFHTKKKSILPINIPYKYERKTNTIQLFGKGSFIAETNLENSIKCQSLIPSHNRR